MGQAQFQSLISLIFFLTVHPAAQAKDIEDVNLNEVALADLMNMNIESASKQVEPLSEAPVPTTVITRDMIKNAGVRTIHEALVLFVPGYTDAEDRNELNFAPRGIYATSQQKVLVMINGHRINSRSYLTAMPDYGIAIHQLDRIEVLRGPGSSLYGNVALSGVVNLITIKGNELAADSVEASAGDHGQRRLRFLVGSGNQESNTLIWGQVYKATGERHDLNGNEPFNSGRTGQILIDGVYQEPAHDVGINFKKNNWSLYGASRHGQWIEPYGTAGNTYNYGAYQTFGENGPGLGMTQRHVGAKYDSKFGDWSFQFNPYFDDTEIAVVLAAAGNNGQVFSWNDESYGFVSHISKDYTLGLGSGNLMIGTQIDGFEVTDSTQLSITGGVISGVQNLGTPLLEKGGEEIYSVFLQNKHRFSDRWILNFGARYDRKNRLRGVNNEKLSPRFALIFLPNINWEYKVSYSQSFVDAPYWYRYNSSVLFAGSEGLNPEVLEATQAQVVWKSDDKTLRNSAVIYYQRGSDLIINRPTSPRYVNSGKIESVGLENELSLLKNAFQVFWNFQYAAALSAVEYSRFDDQFSHVPTLTSNLVFNYLFSKDLSANLSVRHIGEQKYNCGTFTAATACKVDAATLVNLGGRLENAFGSGAFVDTRIFNVLDQQHFQGGQSGTQIPFRQAGRWFLASLGYEF